MRNNFLNKIKEKINILKTNKKIKKNLLICNYRNDSFILFICVFYSLLIIFAYASSFNVESVNSSYSRKSRILCLLLAIKFRNAFNLEELGRNALLI